MLYAFIYVCYIPHRWLSGRIRKEGPVGFGAPGRQHQIFQRSAFFPPMMLLITPELDVPPPFRMTDDEIVGFREKVCIAFNTVKELQDKGLIVLPPTEEEKKDARATFMDSPAADPEIKTSGKAIMLKALLDEYDIDVVRNAQQVRSYIKLKLLELSNDGNPKVELKALDMLGKLTDVGAYAERIDINITHRTTEELENELASKLSAYMSDIIDVDSREIKKTVQHDPLPQAPAVEAIDLDKELGLVGGELEEGDDDQPT